jgi:hypothetical protein
MLRELSFGQFLEWMAYSQLEPFDERRADARAASICSLLANIHRDPKKRSKPFELTDFLLAFDKDDQIAAQPQRQTWQQQKMIAQMIAIAYNEPSRKKRA